MANSMGISIADDIGEMAQDWPATLVFGGVSGTVTRSTITHAPEVDEGGEYANYDVRILVPLSIFTGAASPAPHDVVTLDGTAYHIEDIATDVDGTVAIYGLRRI